MSSSAIAGEPEQDNSSSLNNESSLVAEQGTNTPATTGDDVDSSSIEALNWSEADEEELQHHQAQIDAASAASKTASVKRQRKRVYYPGVFIPKKVPETSEDSKEQLGDEKVTFTPSAGLSSSLLESISSAIDSDESSKTSVIVNWASEVKEAVERGEMEIAEETEEDEDADVEDEGEDEEVTMDQEDNDDEGFNNENSGMRKRIRLSSPESPMSTSSLTLDSTNDPLSNAPVLDDGPIWSKGTKRYTFQENRTCNLILTVLAVLAVVLGIGLGIGSLFATSKCDSEYKTSDPQHSHEPAHQPEIPNFFQSPSKTADSRTAQTNDVPILSVQKSDQQDMSDESVKTEAKSYVIGTPMSNNVDGSSETFNGNGPDKRLNLYMETLTKIVKTIDNLQKKINNFENTTMQLGGIVVLPDSHDDNIREHNSYAKEEEDHEQLKWDFTEENNGESSGTTKEEQQIFELIDGIEETSRYLEWRENGRFVDDLREDSKIVDRDLVNNPITKEEKQENLNIEASFYLSKKIDSEFIRTQRDELREQKILGLAEERLPEDYTEQEIAEIKAKYAKFVKEYPYEAEMEKMKQEIAAEKEFKAKMRSLAPLELEFSEQEDEHPNKDDDDEREEDEEDDDELIDPSNQKVPAEELQPDFFKSWTEDLDLKLQLAGLKDKEFEDDEHSKYSHDKRIVHTAIPHNSIDEVQNPDSLQYRLRYRSLKEGNPKLDKVKRSKREKSPKREKKPLSDLKFDDGMDEAPYKPRKEYYEKKSKHGRNGNKQEGKENPQRRSKRLGEKRRSDKDDNIYIMKERKDMKYEDNDAYKKKKYFSNSNKDFDNDDSQKIKIQTKSLTSKDKETDSGWQLDRTKFKNGQEWNHRASDLGIKKIRTRLTRDKEERVRFRDILKYD